MMFRQYRTAVTAIRNTVNPSVPNRRYERYPNSDFIIKFPFYAEARKYIPDEKEWTKKEEDEDVDEIGEIINAFRDALSKMVSRNSAAKKKKRSLTKVATKGNKKRKHKKKKL